MSAIIGFTLTAIVFFYLGWKAKAKKDRIKNKEQGIIGKVLSWQK